MTDTKRRGLAVCIALTFLVSCNKAAKKSAMVEEPKAEWVVEAVVPWEGFFNITLPGCVPAGVSDACAFHYECMLGTCQGATLPANSGYACGEVRVLQAGSISLTLKPSGAFKTITSNSGASALISVCGNGQPPGP